MTEEQINIAIAESLGCKDCHAVGGLPCGVYPNEREHRALKKYTASLDACAEFEARLTLEQGKTYVGLFDEVCGGELSLSDMADSQQEYLFWCVRATPLQKCEAYLRAKGKWEASA